MHPSDISHAVDYLRCRGRYSARAGSHDLAMTFGPAIFARRRDERGERPESRRHSRVGWCERVRVWIVRPVWTEAEGESHATRSRAGVGDRPHRPRADDLSDAESPAGVMHPREGGDAPVAQGACIFTKHMLHGKLNSAGPHASIAA